MTAIRTGNPSRAVSLIWPVRYDIRLIGGSHAQRDVFEEMLVDASLKGNDPRISRALLAERTARKPNSAWSWQRYGDALGNTPEATTAKAYADALLSQA